MNLLAYTVNLLAWPLQVKVQLRCWPGRVKHMAWPGISADLGGETAALGGWLCLRGRVSLLAWAIESPGLAN